MRKGKAATLFMCGSNRRFTNPPRDRVGTSRVISTRPPDYHSMLFTPPSGYHSGATPRWGYHFFYWTHGNCTLSLHDHGKYHNFHVPDPGNITGYLSSDPRGITKGLCPTHGISLQFSKIKWYSRGGVGQPSIWTTHNSTKEPVTALSQRISWKSTLYSPLLILEIWQVTWFFRMK